MAMAPDALPLPRACNPLRKNPGLIPTTQSYIQHRAIAQRRALYYSLCTLPSRPRPHRRRAPRPPPASSIRACDAHAPLAGPPP
eukprot:scaffold18593_cov115-Isochrysis_galbana.AAC.3